MAFNVNELRSQLTFGGAKASLFQVQIQNPIESIADLKSSFMIKAAAIPASTLGEVEVPYFGRRVKMAGDRTFAPWTVTVINDEDFLVRNAMEAWSAAINSHQGNLKQVASTSAYKTQAQITQFSKTGAPLRVYSFNGLFPTEISEIAMDWGADSTPEEFTVTFSYDWWDIIGGTTGNGGTQV
jgi:hypothetical protein